MHDYTKMVEYREHCWIDLKCCGSDRNACKKRRLLITSQKYLSACACCFANIGILLHTISRVYNGEDSVKLCYCICCETRAHKVLWHRSNNWSFVLIGTNYKINTPLLLVGGSHEITMAYTPSRLVIFASRTAETRNNGNHFELKA